MDRIGLHHQFGFRPSDGIRVYKGDSDQGTENSRMGSIVAPQFNRDRCVNLPAQDLLHRSYSRHQGAFFRKESIHIVFRPFLPLRRSDGSHVGRMDHHGVVGDLLDGDHPDLLSPIQDSIQQ